MNTKRHDLRFDIFSPSHKLASEYEGVIEFEAISKMSFGPMFLSVPRFPALRDGPSDSIMSVGLKSSKYRRIPAV
jgi:hypothetical protein